MSEPTRCGYVAFLGAPNAGKSTLVNALVGEKVSIVTPKVQTTRFRVLGIAMRGSAQLICVDTPGIFAPRRRLDRAMVRAAWQGSADADLRVLLVDAVEFAKGRAGEAMAIAESLDRAGKSAILALNKTDAADKGALLVAAERLNAACPFVETFMISALTGDGVEDLARYLVERLPEGPWLYPADQTADIPVRLLAAEITREQLFMKLRQELPYALTVETEEWQEREDGSARVEQIIYVQRERQKPIVIGEGGHQIKSVGAAARAEIGRVLGRQIHLFLTVKVREDWADDPHRFRAMGLEFDA
ncbi:MAG: GTPase Era [Alphaproteobacteria bacterium]